MALPPLLRPSYWFDLTPPPFLPWVERFLLAGFAILFFAGLMIKLFGLRSGWEKMTKRAFQKASGMLIVLGVFGLLLFVFTFERAYLLSMRFGYLLWAALLGWYVWSLVRFVRVEIPEYEKRKMEREQMNKWLPKANK